MIERAKIGDLVLATWLDAASHDEWQPNAELAKSQPPLIESVGFVVRSDRVALTLAGPRDGSSSSCAIVIPRQMLQTSKIIKVAKNARKTRS